MNSRALATWWLMLVGIVGAGCDNGSESEPSAATQSQTNNPADRQEVAQAMGMGGFGGWGDPPPVEAELPLKYLGDVDHAALKAPTRIAAGPGGDILVSDPLAGAWHVFTMAGFHKYTIEDLPKPLAIGADEFENIYVGDASRGAVYIYRYPDRQVGQLGRPGEFQMPSDLVYHPGKRLIYVVDTGANKVRAYNLAGRFQFEFGGTDPRASAYTPPTDGLFRSPMGIALDPSNDRLLVSDHDNARVQAFTPEGTWLASYGQYGEAPLEFARPQGLATDAQGRMFVVDTFQGRLQVLDAAGDYVGHLGTWGAGNGRLSIPMDSLVDALGRLWVTSQNSSRLVVYGLESYRGQTLSAFVAEWSITPSTINVASSGNLVSATIEVPEADAEQLVVETLRFNDSIAVDRRFPAVFDDADGDGQTEITVRFSRRELIRSFAAPGMQAVTLSGSLRTGSLVLGETTVRVIAPGGGL